jgi:hypothetical protein
MTEIEATELAHAYVALSNAHRVDLIGPMFADDAVYYSSAVGGYLFARLHQSGKAAPGSRQISAEKLPVKEYC